MADQTATDFMRGITQLMAGVTAAFRELGQILNRFGKVFAAIPPPHAFTPDLDMRCTRCPHSPEDH